MKEKFRDDDVRPDELVNILKGEPDDHAFKDIPVVPGNYHKFKRGSRGLPKGIFWGIGGLAVFFIAGMIISWYVMRGQVVGAISSNIATLRAGVEDLKNFDTQSATQKFAALPTSTTELGLWQTLGSFFSGGTGAVGAFADISKQLTALSVELGALQGNTFDFFTNGKGDAAIAELSALRDTVSAIDLDMNALSSAASFAGGVSSLGGADFYLSLKTQIEGAKRFLDAFVPWLSAPAPHHILVLLENPSEMRAAGGFLGSYADITIASGSIANIDVHDIADADRAFAKKIIPPKPLQLEVTRWRPADANWFFDFPASASETRAFFGGTSLYASATSAFEGVIAVSPKVIGDLLSITGPIAIGKPATMFASSTFLVETQKIVQRGQAQSATYPKQILRDLSLALFAKLASSTPLQKTELTNMLFDWIDKKDVMAQFNNPSFESFFDLYGASGAVYQLPEKFNGSYFAMVDTNINGGKSDLYVTSTIAYTATIEPDGMLTAHVAITRKHSGNRSPYPWYKTTNTDYMEFFVPDGTTLTNASGGMQKKIKAPIDYAAEGYIADPLVLAIEATEQSFFNYPSMNWHAEAGKKVFTTWSTVKPGTSARLSLDYMHRMFEAPSAGAEYQFVFEKQSGSVRHYDLIMNAPLGYVFTENGVASYEYISDDPPGRLIITLTLAKLRE